MKIAIIGAGLMGLALARQLSQQGHAVTVLEKEKQLGGLTTHHDYGPFCWDRFYHVILPSDTHLLAFLRDIGLADRLRWHRTSTGFYVDQEFHSMSSAWEFLTFPALSLVGKLRLALTILYCARLSDWRSLEAVPVDAWLRKTCGARTFEKLWKPLLLAKLGEHYQKVSAVFIWSYIARMYSARDAAAQRETLGYVSGGYKTVFDRLAALICEAGGTLRAGVTVSRVEAAAAGGLSVAVDGVWEHFDKVVYTGPVNLLERLASEAVVEVGGRGRGIEYLGVLCMVLVTRSPLVPFYVVNIADSRVPFTGLIGMSNLVSAEETRGLHLTYLPKYLHAGDPLFQASDGELKNLFFAGLKLMLPTFDPRNVVAVHVNRAAKVQPLQVLGYSDLVPRAAAQHEDFFVLNTSQFVNNTLNNNEVIRAVNAFTAEHDFSQRS